jgi:hypothetical protein
MEGIYRENWQGDALAGKAMPRLFRLDAVEILVGAEDDLPIGKGEGGVGVLALGEAVGLEDMELGRIGFDDKCGAGLVGEVEEIADMIGAGPGSRAEAGLPDFAAGACFDALGDAGFIEDEDVIANDDPGTDALLIGFDDPQAVRVGDIAIGHAIGEAETDGRALVSGHGDDEVFAGESVGVAEIAESGAVPEFFAGFWIEGRESLGEGEEHLVASVVVENEEGGGP